MNRVIVVAVVAVVAVVVVVAKFIFCTIMQLLMYFCATGGS